MKSIYASYSMILEVPMTVKYDLSTVEPDVRVGAYLVRAIHVVGSFFPEAFVGFLEESDPQVNAALLTSSQTAY